MAEDEDTVSASGKRLDRRKIITGAVAAGGLIWAAPVVSSVSASAAQGSPKTTTTTTTTIPTTTSTSTTSTTEPTTTTTTVPCNCKICAVVTTPTGGTLYFTCEPTTQEGCDCLCNCGGVDIPCSSPTPCTQEMACVQVTEQTCGA